jgi:hypothetical protein
MRGRGMMQEEEREPHSLPSDAMDRLRDRTDELELIISSLTIFALFSLPGWFFNALANSFTHISTSVAIAGNLGASLLTGVCYGLGTCFVVHLIARAYWVGLIGLRSAFPKGIQWHRTRSIGPVTKEHYQRTLPDLGAMIAGTDRLASSLFSVISMLTLSMLWLGTIVILTLVVAGTIGTRFGLTNTFLSAATLTLLVLFLGLPALIYLLDAQLARRFARIRGNRTFVATLGVMRKVSGVAYPKRLILPVQLTLQSNLPPFVFSVTMTLAVAIIIVLGNYRVTAWRNFTLSGEFVYLTDEDVQSSFRSTHYEDMPSGLDRLRGWPRIPSFTQQGSFIPLFLPYHPLRDNLVLEQICGERESDSDAAQCLQRLWTITLAGKEIPVEGFIAAERADIGMRGLLGALPTEGLVPGLNKIEVVWNPGGNQDSTLIDDRYEELSFNFSIPFLFSPGVERALE